MKPPSRNENPLIKDKEFSSPLKREDSFVSSLISALNEDGSVRHGSIAHSSAHQSMSNLCSRGSIGSNGSFFMSPPERGGSAPTPQL